MSISAPDFDAFVGELLEHFGNTLCDSRVDVRHTDRGHDGRHENGLAWGLDIADMATELHIAVCIFSLRCDLRVFAVPTRRTAFHAVLDLGKRCVTREPSNTNAVNL